MRYNKISCWRPKKRKTDIVNTFFQNIKTILLRLEYDNPDCDEKDNTLNPALALDYLQCFYLAKKTFKKRSSIDLKIGVTSDFLFASSFSS